MRLFVTPWSIQSMEFSRPEYWSGWPFPSLEDLPNPGIKPRSPTLQADSLPAEPPGKPESRSHSYQGASHGGSDKSGKLEVGGASRHSTGFGALEEGLISS